MIRRITWQDPDTGAAWRFLTNEPEQTRRTQVLGHQPDDQKRPRRLPLPDLIVLWENELAHRGIRNTAEKKRRASRLEKRTKAAAAASRKMPSIITGVQRLIQYSVKLVRWLRNYLWSRAPLDKLCLILTQLYKTF